MNMVNSAISDIVSKTSGLEFSMSDLANGSTSTYLAEPAINGKPNTYFTLASNDGHPYDFSRPNVSAKMGENTMTFNLTGRLWRGEEFTVNNIQNAAVHEGNGHFVNGISGQGKKHANAYQLQMNHSSWKGSKKNWKAEMQKSMEAIIQGRL